MWRKLDPYRRGSHARPATRTTTLINLDFTFPETIDRQHTDRCNVASRIQPDSRYAIPVQLRAAPDAVLLGSAEQHRTRVAELVLDSATADDTPRVAVGIA
jgi:hypothetical protein